MNFINKIKSYLTHWTHWKPEADKPAPSAHLQQCLKKVWRDPMYFIAFGFGSGLMRKAPGTWGTLAGVPVYLLLAHLSPNAYLIVTLIGFLVGVIICNQVSRELGVNDYSGIVWDEIIGYLITMSFAPVCFSWMVLGFILFRFFDIWKPEPIRFIDKRIKGGLGIMLDDVIAAIPAWLILRLLIWIFES